MKRLLLLLSALLLASSLCEARKPPAEALGTRIFNLGNMENPFLNNGIAGVKNSIKAVYGNDINVTLTDDDDPNAVWTLTISDDVPPQIRVSIPATATLGEHTLQVRFVSQWKNYDYTFKVNVQ